MKFGRGRKLSDYQRAEAVKARPDPGAHWRTPKAAKSPKTRRKWGVNVSLISLNFFADSRARARTRKSVRPAGALVTSAELVRREIRKLSNDELHQVRLDIETLLRERLG